MRILLVCLGNICRSPTAEGALRRALTDAGLTHIHVESAGTGSHHEGDGADPRTVRHAKQRGIDLSAHRARGVRDADFARFDHLWCMDAANLSALRARCPAEHRAKIRLFLEDGAEVPDPYYGDAHEFERVLDLCESAAARLVQRWRRA
jgi:protein-tyrosine phosphatase